MNAKIIPMSISTVCERELVMEMLSKHVIITENKSKSHDMKNSLVLSP